MTDRTHPDSGRIITSGDVLRELHEEIETLRMGYAAARLEIESLRAAQPAGAQQPGAVYAALPEKYYLAGGEVPTWDEKQMRAFADATHTLRASHGQAPAQAAPAAVAGPVVNRATVIEWLDANDIEVTDRQMDGLFHFAAPTTQPAPGEQNESAYQRGYMDGMAKGRRDVEAAPQQEALIRQMLESMCWAARVMTISEDEAPGYFAAITAARERLGGQHGTDK